MDSSGEEMSLSETVMERVNTVIEAAFIEMDKAKFYLPDELLYKINNPDLEFILHLSIVIAIIILISSFIAWKMGKKVKEKIPENIKKKVQAAKEFVVPPSGPRFRKRDKIAFVGQKMVKRVQAASSYIRGGQGRKRKAIAKFAKRLLGHGGSPEIIGQNFKLDLPLEYLEEDTLEPGAGKMPQQLKLILQNMRVFGHFEHPIFLELVKQIEYLTVNTNQYLFKVGDPDESIFIVQSGQVNVYASDAEVSNQATVKHVTPGDSIMSLLSFLDHLAGYNKPYKTVSARAIEDSKIIRLPYSAFKIAFEKYPDCYLRVVQIVMIRLQRVTLLALHQYLGLGAELIAKQHRGDMNVKFTDDPDELKTPEEEDNPLESEQLTPTTPSALQLQLESYKEITSGNITRSSMRRKSSLARREKMMQFALKSFKDQLKLESDAILEGKIELRDIPPGFRIMEEDSLKDAALVLVIDGCLRVSQKNEEGKEQELHLCYAGGLLGQLQVLTGEASIFTVEASVQSKVACLSREVVFDMMSVQHDVTLHLAMSVIEHISPYVRSIDFALDWVLVESGHALYKQGQDADCTYVVLSGRLRSVVQRSDGKKELVGEYGRGELCGIVETLTGAKRNTTLLAVRDTEIAKIPGGLINSIKLRFPKVVSKLITLLSKKLLRLQQPGLSHGVKQVGDDPAGFQGYSTVAVISVTPGVPLQNITAELVFSLSELGSARCITPEVVKHELGHNALDPSNDFKLTAWLGAQEDNYKTVIYQCDDYPSITSWTQQCIRHADVLLVFADAKQSSSVSAFEEKIETSSLRVTKELVLCHSEDTIIPTHTAKWLEVRPWISHHYHIKVPDR